MRAISTALALCAAMPALAHDALPADVAEFIDRAARCAHQAQPDCVDLSHEWLRLEVLHKDDATALAALQGNWRLTVQPLCVVPDSSVQSSEPIELRFRAAPCP